MFCVIDGNNYDKRQQYLATVPCKKLSEDYENDSIKNWRYTYTAACFLARHTSISVLNCFSILVCCLTLFTIFRCLLKTFQCTNWCLHHITLCIYITASQQFLQITFVSTVTMWTPTSFTAMNTGINGLLPCNTTEHGINCYYQHKQNCFNIKQTAHGTRQSKWHRKAVKKQCLDLHRNNQQC